MDAAAVEKIAHLARLALEPGEAEATAPHMTRILGFVEQMGAADTDEVEPLASPHGTTTTLERVDAVTEGGQAAAVLANAPEARAGFFVVPKVVEQEG
ncbi:MAG TPA: Asp-tRNA(Asn)/Glu-tRNA(Gln) amidotransferase GatCAB subunit C [Rhodospirillaceae bacterium]|jgi:aspartyl-tRNA(Asn)/glutamyl-tRNA(Gln) amidotransferase subunit C|nr:Asp-tRNA(Asn)/Glu-tRNA(Gln) amidotransferase subunit GatC [Alphaproteobacteria bacterium]HBH26661.1 Asp-tRNA(Asn)/Glu-tRNA(Gln) amidotransferase GatCAB subunit C [Rhodospirillaceae bacterium]